MSIFEELTHCELVMPYSNTGNIGTGNGLLPSHYLNQSWLIISGVLWQSPETNFAGSAQDINLGNELEKYI